MQRAERIKCLASDKNSIFNPRVGVMRFSQHSPFLRLVNRRRTAAAVVRKCLNRCGRRCSNGLEICAENYGGESYGGSSA